MNPSIGRGFASRLPNQSEIAAIREHFKSIIGTWRTQKLKVVYAYLNALTYRACRHMGVIKQARRAEGERKGFHRIVGDIKAIALSGISKFNISIEGVVDQLCNFWDIKISEASMRKYRYELRDVFGLFWFQSQVFPKGDKGNVNARRPPALEKFNLPLACILLEAIESALVKERECELEDFPGSGAMGRFIYNALFKGVASYRRKSIVEDVPVFYQGGKAIYVSEMDWHVELTDEGEAAWLGGVTLIPDEEGAVPVLI